MNKEINTIFDDANNTPTSVNNSEIKSIFDDTKEIEETIEVLQLDEEKTEELNLEESKEEIKTIEETADEIDPQNQIEETEIKENKIKKYVFKYSKLLPIISFIFVLILGFYIVFGNISASKANLIKIEENGKIGYINNKGKVIIKPKYLYGSDFYKGYAVVKNYNNLYGIVNSRGKMQIPFGNIFSANLYSDRYIVSKFTSDGLKMGLLDSKLKEITRFKYDNISYAKFGLFIFNYEDTMGIINKEGKEIYSYKVAEVDNKDISIEISNVNDNTYDSYAVIKVNQSSTIINTKTGKEVYKYTLDDISVLDNNVFYIKNSEGNNKYFIIKNDRIVFETEDYKVIRVEDIKSNIAICINNDSKIDYINLLKKEIINTEGEAKYTYSDGILLQQMYNFEKNKNVYTVLTPEKTISTFEDVITVDDTYVNGFMIIKLNDGKYSFVNKDGKVITSGYDMVYNFNKNGYAVVLKDNLYGVINDKGKLVLDLKYDDIKLLDDVFFNNIYNKTNRNLFIIKIDNKYGIIDSNKKVVLDTKYDSIKTITKKYMIIKATKDGDDILINLNNFKELNIKLDNDISIYNNYIKSIDYYYNYNGELIYPLGG